MSQKRKRERRKIAGLSCGQMLLLFLLVVVVASGAAIAFGYALGILDLFPQEPTADQTTSPPGAQDVTKEPETIHPDSQQESPNVTLLPTQMGTITPVITETESTTATSTPTPTTPPTAPADVCAMFALSYLNATSNIVAWRMRNNSGQPFTLNRVEITWPGSNDAIFNAFLDGNVIWSGQDLVSPTIMTSWFGERDDRTVESLSRLEFFFGTAAAESGYNLTLRFENGCQVMTSR